MGTIEDAAAMLRLGKMVAIYDGDEREGEADLMFHASFAEPGKIETLRKDAGGLICLSLGRALAEKLHLPFYTDILANSGRDIAKMECTKTAYKDKPAFAIPVNHKDVFTGITDNDRAHTIKEVSKLAEADGDVFEAFSKNFYSPGHVFLLIGRGIENRKGHTELSLELAKKAGMSPVMVICEMLGRGSAMPKEKVKEYCKANEITFIEGGDFDG
jgi:3,4-dihydroxy 2-butanone 4-phosphate synthase